LRIEPHLNGDTRGIRAVYTVLSREGEPVAQMEAQANAEVTMELENPILWNGLTNPYLYTVRASLFRGDTEIDAVQTRVGFRTISFDSEKGCFLNGNPMKLKGVSRHQDRYHMGNALTEKEHREDLAFIREVGANSIRLAHYQQDQRFYDACDEMGFLVWAEVPVISHFVDAKFENAKQQLTELITQNKNHPCIYCWGVQNEITMNGKAKTMEPGIRALNDLAHRLDATRPTTSAQVMMCGTSSPMNRITDLQGYNLYFGWYMQTYHAIDQWLDQFHSEYPEIKLCLSEYGAEGILNYQTEEGVQGDYSEAYQARFHEHYARAIAERDWLWGSYVWNMFDFGAANRDEGGMKGRNNKGLVTIDRKTRKDSFYVYKAFWSDEPFVHIGGERYVDRVVGTTAVPVYSNLHEVTLTVNGESVTKPCDRVVYFEDIPVAAGEFTVTAEAGGCTHSIRIRGVAEANPDYRMQGDSGSFIKNWFVNTDGKRNPDYFSIDDRAGALLKSRDVQSLIQTFLGSRRVPSILFAIVKPFRVRTLLKLARLDEGMKEIAEQYLQTIHK
jgi:beta-galactosidase